MTSEKSENIYSVPLPPDLITQVVTDSLSHQGPYQGAVDMAVPISTPVFAAADGIVTRTEDKLEQYGIDEKYGRLVNYITIKHPHEELSEYLHLAKGSVIVKVGSKVVRGQKIAETGLSGRMTAPHLHFIVYKYADNTDGFKALEVQFNEPITQASTSTPRATPPCLDESQGTNE